MVKKLLAIILGFGLAPAFISAETTAGGGIVGTVCLVRVYHTNFVFPPQGGRIVQIGNEMYFWRDYLPQCANFIPATHPTVPVVATQGVNVINPIEGKPSQLVGEPCAVRVYHTNFVFPPQGGRIVQYGNEMYFIRDYKPECAGAGAGGVVIATSTRGVTAVNPTVVGTTTQKSNCFVQ